MEFPCPALGLTECVRRALQAQGNGNTPDPLSALTAQDHPNDCGGAMTVSNVQALVKRLARAAGIDRDFGGGKKRRRGLGPHIIRHTYATRKLEEGFKLREIQKLLGHSNVSTTQIYTEVTDEALRAKVQGQDKRDEITALREQVADAAGVLAALQAGLDELEGR